MSENINLSDGLGDSVGLPSEPESSDDQAISMGNSNAPQNPDDKLWWRSVKADKIWDYHDARGEIVAQVYRWTHPETGAKVIRPWNPLTGQWETPKGPRPLFGIPEILERPDDTVVLVEGEKCVDAIRAPGWLGTTVMGGANAVKKADWSPLKDRKIVLWRDNDSAGLDWEESVLESLRAAEVALVHSVAIPQGKPPKWDAADADDDERTRLLDDAYNSEPIYVGPPKFNPYDWLVDRFTSGDPPPRRYLVDKILPLGQAGMLAAAGDIGKSMMTLDLALNVASGGQDPKTGGVSYQMPQAFGGEVCEHGDVVIWCAEDEKDEIHRRIHTLDPDRSRRNAITDRGRLLYIVPLPNAGGVKPFFIATSQKGVQTTVHFDEFSVWLRQIPDLRLVVVDPLASFVHADVNADTAAGAFVTGMFAALASETGATVLIAHHMSKGDRTKPIRTAQDARHAVRGTTALVDGLRFVYALWPAEEKDAKQICEHLGLPYRGNQIVHGAVVKANGPADRTVRTYIRDENSGALIDWTSRVRSEFAFDGDAEEMLIEAVRQAAAKGRPFTYSGQTGLDERREELPDEFEKMRRDPLRNLAKKVLSEQRIVKASYGKVVAKWLDIPGGPFAQGIGSFAQGFTGAGDSK